MSTPNSGPAPTWAKAKNSRCRRAWERELAAGGWVGMGWPEEYGGRDLPLTQQMIFSEEYARAGGPQRVGLLR